MGGLVLHPDDIQTAVECAAVSVSSFKTPFLSASKLIFHLLSQASFIIEQFGLPSVETVNGKEELWNGASPKERLEKLQSRRKYLQQ